MVRRLWVLALSAAMVLFAITAAVAVTASKNLTITVAGSSVSGFYVATNGNDSNVGTLASPFATLQKCQTAMRVSSVKTCYIRAGTYNLGSASTDSCSLGGNGPLAIDLVGADAGETWSWYPPDGAGPVITGNSSGVGSGTKGAFCVNSTTPAINFTGLVLTNFQNWGILAMSPVNIFNNETKNTTTNFGNNGGLIGSAIELYCTNVSNSQVYNNYVHDNSDRGITVEICTGGNQNGVSIHNNFLYNNCTGFGDCGAIYFTGPPGGGYGAATATDNYIRDSCASLCGGDDTGGGGAQGSGVYFDACTDSVTASGNVITGTVGTIAFWGNSTNNHFNNNIGNLGNNSSAIIWYQNNFACSGSMAGNQFENNIIVANTASPGGIGFNVCCGGSGPPTLPTVGGNSYFNYGSGGAVTITCTAGNFACGSIDNLTKSRYQNPQLHCWGALLGSGSPVFGGPVSFPAQPSGWDTAGYWGLPGFTVSETGNAPAWPTTSGDGVTCTSSNAAPGFYVATSGNDSNAGTLAQPFATLGRCQSAMQGSSTKTCYIRAGTYSLSTSSGVDACSLGSNGPTALNLTVPGVTYSYYPPDGFNTAIFDGGSTGVGTGINNMICLATGSATPVVFNGIHFRNANHYIFFSQQSTVTFTNNEVSGQFFADGVGDYGCIVLFDGQGSQITHNYIHDCGDRGIDIEQTAGSTTNNITVQYNYMQNNCRVDGDCGAIYYFDGVMTPATGVVISDNFIRDIDSTNTQLFVGASVGFCIYFDSSAFNKTITNNVCTGHIGYANPNGGGGNACFFIHAGSNNSYTSNICDEGTNNSTMEIINSQSGSNNSFTKNLIIANQASGGAGYACFGSEVTPSTNDYYNYNGPNSPNINAGGCVSDPSPQRVNPLLHCWGAIIAPTSPILAPSTVNFAVQPVGYDTPGYWGPPGFTMPHTGTAPTWPTTSGDGVTCTSTN